MCLNFLNASSNKSKKEKKEKKESGLFSLVHLRLPEFELETFFIKKKTNKKHQF